MDEWTEEDELILLDHWGLLESDLDLDREYGPSPLILSV